MAFSKALPAALVLLSLVLLQDLAQSQLDPVQVHLVGIGAAPSPSPLPQKLNCTDACGGRCKKSKRPNLCNRACGSCCHKCNCVPPSTAGNYYVCPCYANMTFVKNGTVYHKCP